MDMDRITKILRTVVFVDESYLPRDRLLWSDVHKHECPFRIHKSSLNRLFYTIIRGIRVTYNRI